MRDIAKEAETVIKNLKSHNNGNIFLKTNQIRKFLTAVNAITNRVDVYKAKNLQANILPDDLASEIKFLKVKIAYQVGRESGYQRPVTNFVQEAHIMERIDEIGTDMGKYAVFAQYMEALVAYHKYYGGKD
ncbi:CRISPR-associated protein Csm2 [Megasphaera cerevisiae DSM 20462]|jgi:CRISPR-associated protein Csm2|uniref:CRISPR system Cms protein Csm2 n=1 Tax=Megasphaera cerevisiae DSM 20462 TaxID=1122219 RepID=A0A0J6WPK5_9FIRM|nr:type III-A CRISPR-associated protein Csm2 [Megasphaera cerevisiae]KMO85340.1 CRISPR-associated protein Csm2 [Megasphaera cerevisiae DSM 20462]SKA23309.1 CRISPR-associated protein Csm2 [Megasphaera cerevisiae DSM 20462]